MFYIMAHSTHVIYGYMTSDIERKPVFATLWATLSKQQQGILYINHPTDRITHTTAFIILVNEHWLEREIAYKTERKVKCFREFFHIKVDQLLSRTIFYSQ